MEQAINSIPKADVLPSDNHDHKPMLAVCASEEFKEVYANSEKAKELLELLKKEINLKSEFVKVIVEREFKGNDQTNYFLRIYYEKNNHNSIITLSDSFDFLNFDKENSYIFARSSTRKHIGSISNYNDILSHVDYMLELPVR